MPAFDIQPYIQQAPAQVRQMIRTGIIDFPTAGMAAGYAQANLVILPQMYAHDFREWIRQNPQACPLLETVKQTPLTKTIARHANICTDIPRYRLYENGHFTKEVTDVTPYWQADMVGFLIGCSFSFEEALLKAGIEIRHLTEKHNVPMYKTNIMTSPVGRFKGPTVVSCGQCRRLKLSWPARLRPRCLTFMGRRSKLVIQLQLASLTLIIPIMAMLIQSILVRCQSFGHAALLRRQQSKTPSCL